MSKTATVFKELEKTKDDCGRVLAQLMNGNSLPDMEYYLSNRVYDVSDFAQKSSLQLYCRERKKYNSMETPFNL